MYFSFVCVLLTCKNSMYLCTVLCIFMRLCFLRRKYLCGSGYFIPEKKFKLVTDKLIYVCSSTDKPNVSFFCIPIC